MNHKSVRKLSRVAFWGFIRALQSNLNIYFTPQSAAPHLELKLCLAAGRAGTWERTAPNNTVCTVRVPQSVRYHKLPQPRLLRVCYQPGQATWRVRSKVYVWNIYDIYPNGSYIYLYIVTTVKKNIYNISYSKPMPAVINCLSSGFWLNVWT